MGALGTFLRGAALGAAAMYLLDPDRGRRRRAVARDKLRSAASQASTFVDAAGRDARHRLRAVRVRAARIGSGDEAPSDVVLVERVRARLGRVVRHPHALRVHAERGRVRLAGPILVSEHAPLMRAVRHVRGVRAVDDEALALYRSADHVSALQGGRERPRNGLLQENWSPALRLAAILGGGMLALQGLARHGPARLALSSAGLGLMARAAVNRPLERLLDRDMPGVRARSGMAEGVDDWTATAPLAPPAAQPGL
jgi:hypothetical protein